MIKKEYMKPTMTVVTLQQTSIICTSPLTSVSTTGLDEGDGLDIDDEEVGTGFWGR